MSSFRMGQQHCSSSPFSGDSRANEQINLAVMHTIWMREHNRIASDLRKLNPSWNDEKLYQEARRINVAQYQHIVYKEWLPLVLGHDFMDKFGLWPLSKGYSDSYMDTFDPRITNEFAASAFRFGHSLIPDTFKRVPRSGSVGGQQGRSATLSMKDVFFKPDALRKNAGEYSCGIRLSAARARRSARHSATSSFTFNPFSQAERLHRASKIRCVFLTCSKTAKST